MKKLFVSLAAFIFVILVGVNTINITGENTLLTNNNKVCVAAVIHGPPVAFNLDNNRGTAFENSVNWNTSIGANSSIAVGNMLSITDQNTAQNNLQCNNSLNLNNNGQEWIITNANPRSNNSFNITGATQNTVNSNIVIGQMNNLFNHWTNSAYANIAANFFDDTGQMVILDNNTGQVGSNYILNANITSANLNNNITNVQLVNNVNFTVNLLGAKSFYDNELQVAETARSAPTYSLNNNNLTTLNLTAATAMMKFADANIQPQYNLLI